MIFEEASFFNYYPLFPAFWKDKKKKLKPLKKVALFSLCLRKKILFIWNALNWFNWIYLISLLMLNEGRTPSELPSNAICPFKTSPQYLLDIIARYYRYYNRGDYSQYWKNSRNDGSSRKPLGWRIMHCNVVIDMMQFIYLTPTSTIAWIIAGAPSLTGFYLGLTTMSPIAWKI